MTRMQPIPLWRGRTQSQPPYRPELSLWCRPWEHLFHSCTPQLEQVYLLLQPSQQLECANLSQKCWQDSRISPRRAGCFETLRRGQTVILTSLGASDPGLASTQSTFRCSNRGLWPCWGQFECSPPCASSQAGPPTPKKPLDAPSLQNHSEMAAF